MGDRGQTFLFVWTLGLPWTFQKTNGCQGVARPRPKAPATPQSREWRVVEGTPAVGEWLTGRGPDEATHGLVVGPNVCMDYTMTLTH